MSQEVTGWLVVPLFLVTQLYSKKITEINRMKFMLKLRVLFFTLIFFQQVYSQSHSVSGYIEDTNTGERIVGAYVFDNMSKSIVQTNNFGFYNLIVKDHEVALQATYMGLKSEIVHINTRSDTLVIIKIQPVKELKEVEITASAYKRDVNSFLGLVAIPVSHLTSLPALGESDLVKSIQNQPGIKGGVEGSTGIFVRGGGAGENLFMLDDVPMYNISHLYGFFSIFNSSAIKDIKLYKGCFPAMYGGRASSVIDVRSLDGNNKSIKGEISVGLISSKVTIEGPFLSPKTTFMISGRRSYFDLYSGTLKSLKLLDLNFPGYYFYDLNFRVSHTISLSDKLFLGIYRGKDKIQYNKQSSGSDGEIVSYSDQTKETSGWGNFVGSLRWNHTFSNNLFVNTTLAYSRYDYFILSQYNSSTVDSVNVLTPYDNYSSSYKSDISDLILKTDFDFSISNAHKLSFGLGTTFHDFNPGKNIYSMYNTELRMKMDTSFSNINLKDNEPYLYVEDEIILTKKVLIRAGFRLSGLIADSKLNINPEPRFSANYSISSRLAVKAGYSKMIQYMHLLSTSGLSMPTDIWVPSLKGLYPLKSDQINFGFTYNCDRKILILIEIYRKWLNHTTDFRNGASLLTDFAPWFNKTTQGTGNAKGIELSIEKQEGKFTGSINYSLSKADRKYTEINNGRVFPFKYDRLHDFNLSLNYKLSKKWDISAFWQYGTGYPVTIPIEKYIPALNIVYGPQHNFIYYYPSLNNYRLSDYHRLDIGFHYKTQTRLGEQSISFDIFNAYNHKNAVNMYYLQNFSFKSIYLLPIIPSVTYTLKFK
jgi:hypothetical protein